MLICFYIDDNTDNKADNVGVFFIGDNTDTAANEMNNEVVKVCFPVDDNTGNSVDNGGVDVFCIDDNADNIVDNGGVDVCFALIMEVCALVYGVTDIFVVCDRLP